MTTTAPICSREERWGQRRPRTATAANIDVDIYLPHVETPRRRPSSACRGTHDVNDANERSLPPWNLNDVYVQPTKTRRQHPPTACKGMPDDNDADERLLLTWNVVVVYWAQRPRHRHSQGCHRLRVHTADELLTCRYIVQVHV